MGKIIRFLSGAANVVFKTCIVTISNIFKENIFYHYGFFVYLTVSAIKINFYISLAVHDCEDCVLESNYF